MVWAPNLGKCPRFAAGRRVFVRLRNGMRPAESWAADGRQACRWAIDNSPFDIVEFELA
jgi:hypothetical protein